MISQSSKPQQSKQHKLSIAQLCSALKTNIKTGMTNEAAQQRNRLQGNNQLPEKERQPTIIRFLKEITNWFAIMLWIGSFLCIVIYIVEPEGNQANLYLAIVLIMVILITGLITFLQAEQSQAMMAKFKQMLPLTSKVLRSGKLQHAPASQLVRGDVIEISNGEQIPADVRIIQANNMKVDNSSLTGETRLLTRQPECTHQNQLDTKNLAFFGTLCKSGRGKGIVIKIGVNTFMGKIANLSEQKVKDKTPLRIQLDRFVLIITIIACLLGIFFILFGKFVVGYSILQCIIFGIGIIVANVPEGVLACVTISLAITAKKLADKKVLVKNLQSVQTLGSTSCICSDKTGTLTMNKMTVNHIWINGISSDVSIHGLGLGKIKGDSAFNLLLDTAVLSSEAQFQLSQEELNQVHIEQATVMGDASQTAFLKFIQHITSVDKVKNQTYAYAKTTDNKKCFVPFNSQVKYSFGIARKNENNGETGAYKIFIKGAPQKLWQMCSHILVDDKIIQKNKRWKIKFDQANTSYGQNGQRVLGFAYRELKRQKYSKDFKFNINENEAKNFQLNELVFIGLMSLLDPPKASVSDAIKKCRTAGIKVIMITGDQAITAVSIAKQIGIISFKSNLDYQKFGYSPAQAIDKAPSIAIHGSLIEHAFKLGQQNGQASLQNWIRKPQVVFSRTSPLHKLQIVKACQRLGYIVGVTGDGVNDAPAIKQANIGISMGLSGSDVTKDAADMILLSDDFACIVDGIQQGRKIFDNLKKTTVYLLTSNMTQIWPFAELVIFQIPLPLSNIFMLCICVGTDIYPAISLAYEQPELDIMTRQPRKLTQHLTSTRMMVHSYGLMGTIATAGGFFTYFLIMELYGFPPSILFNLLGQPAVSPMRTTAIGQLVQHIKANEIYQYDATARNLGNHAIPTNCQQAIIATGFPSWLTTVNNRYDLRGAYNVCCPSPNQQHYCAIFNWPAETHVLDTVSQFTGIRVRFTIQSLSYAQSGYFFTIVLVQWTNIFACKSRKTSFIYSGFNKHIIIGIVFETVIGICLLYVPGLNKIFGGRPLNFFLLGLPGLTFAMLLLTWQEGRKYLMNMRGKDDLDANWFETHLFW